MIFNGQDATCDSLWLCTTGGLHCVNGPIWPGEYFKIIFFFYNILSLPIEKMNLENVSVFKDTT